MCYILEVQDGLDDFTAHVRLLRPSLVRGLYSADSIICS